MENKVVPVFPCPESGVWCHFTILQKYIGKLPPVAFQKDWFYMKPLGDSVATDPSKPWYAAQPCGENKLGGMVRSMFAEIGVSWMTNHSLRATGASDLFQAGVLEKIIQERTGHRSVEALCTYERKTTMQHMAVSKVLSAKENCRFLDAQPKPGSSENAIGFSSVFANTSNCVINVNICGPPKAE